MGLKKILTIHNCHGFESIFPRPEMYESEVFYFLDALNALPGASSLLEHLAESLFRCVKHQVTDIQDAHLSGEGIVQDVNINTGFIY